MREKVVRQVMVKYFESKGVKAIQQTGAGPDLLIDGKAVEVKGTKLDYARMLKQLSDYALKYSDLALALPYDCFTLDRAVRLSITSSLIETARDIRLRVYLVAPDRTKEDSFYIREIKAAEFISITMRSVIPWDLGIHEKVQPSTLLKAVERLIGFAFVNKLKAWVYMKYDPDVSRIEV